jgi:class 3 adenylate cyclase/pimeloyl-ACP methyl ester carboxylesterase
MEQEIRFCMSADGVRIAYATVGEGPPLVVSSSWLGHLQFEWTQPEVRAFWGRLAAWRKVIRYDRRGTGLSDRDVDDLSLEARVRDLEAVVQAAAQGEVELLGMSEGGPTSIAFAARHPERVRRLILYGSYAHLFSSPKNAEPVVGLVRTQWGMGSAALTAIFISSGDPAEAALFTEMQRISASGETAARILEEIAHIDVRQCLEGIKTPTLVIHRKGDLHPVDCARELATHIPDARLELLDGDIYPPWLGDSNAVLNSILRFLGCDEAITPKSRETPSSGTTAAPVGVILFADIADSTGLTERLGDAAFRAKARDLDTALRTVIHDHTGTPIEGKLLGDGVLAVFTSARQAIEAALACAGTGHGAGLPLHLGLHAGDVIREDNNVYGGAVNIASRISGLSAPGEVLVSETVRSLARTSAGVRFEDRGEQSLKGVGEAVRVWVVVEGE